jgi:hypothetical protein
MSEESKCAECGKLFVATNENSVDIRIYGLYGTACKSCFEEMKRTGKIRIVKYGESDKETKTRQRRL